MAPAGVAFIDDNGGGPGVRLRKWQPKKGHEPQFTRERRRSPSPVQIRTSRFALTAISAVRRILRAPSLTRSVAQGADRVAGCTILVYMTTIVIRGWFLMRKIQLKDAKANLSAVVDQATQGKPSVITRHGKPEAVVLGFADWQRLSRVPSFGRLLMSVPLEPGDLPERNRGPMRDAGL